jgi:hypothetical protein
MMDIGDATIDKSVHLRKDPIRSALARGRFARLEENIDARPFWPELLRLESIRKRISDVEIKEVEKIFQSDERKRSIVLSKCLLLKNVIPNGQHIKFAESMIYFTQCDSLKKTFSLSALGSFLRTDK